MTDNVLLEVEKTFDFFKATAASDHISRIVLSGGASRVESFADSLRERFDTEVELFDPFKQVTFDVKKLGVSPQEMAPLSAVAVGLALRKVGDR
jgi:type IV pilus assembly protein PilM